MGLFYVASNVMLSVTNREKAQPLSCVRIWTKSIEVSLLSGTYLSIHMVALPFDNKISFQPSFDKF